VGQRKYIDDIEIREDGGTPGFLQAIKNGLRNQIERNAEWVIKYKLP